MGFTTTDTAGVVVDVGNVSDGELCRGDRRSAAGGKRKQNGREPDNDRLRHRALADDRQGDDYRSGRVGRSG